MEPHPPDEASAASPPEMQTGSNHHRPFLLRAVLAGIMAGVPAAWILAYLTSIPYFLGLFFFLLIGLLVGAVMYRSARAGAPIPRPRTTPVSLVVAVLISLGVLVIEYRWFPDLVVQKAMLQSLLSGMSRQERDAYRERVRQVARDHIDGYWPGGFPGYLRWAVTSGRINLPRAGSDQPFRFENLQLPLSWIVRVVASLALLIFAIDSQMASLAPRVVSDEPDGTPPEPDHA